MNELQQLRDEVTQLNTALTIKNGTIEQLKARNKQLEDRNAMLTARAEEQQAPARQVPLSRQFVDAVKQLCKDFSDRQDRPYMGDVYAALDGLLEYEQMPVAAPQAEQPSNADAARLDFIEQHPGWLRKSKRSWCCVNPFGSSPFHVYNTPREAIDHAMQEQFCDGHCTWLDHHPDCEIGKAGQSGGES